jgi:predicted amidohydrolase
MIIALASPKVATSLDEGLAKVEWLMGEAAAQGAEIVCFPEAYLPGLYGVDINVLPFTRADQERVLESIAAWAKRYALATIFCLGRLTGAGRQIAAYVFDAQGQLQGIQTKNQIAPSEDAFYMPGETRQLFEVNGVKFGVAICHEGWRYPETVRWAAVRGAQIVFQPQHTGSNESGVTLTHFGSVEAPYYEKAMVVRSIENTIYFASVNYALRYPETATCVIDPNGACQAFLPYGEEGVLVQEIDITAATGLIASRYAPERYQEAVPV